MADLRPSPIALEGAEPQKGHWPEPCLQVTEMDRQVYPGEGRALISKRESGQSA